MKLRQIIIIVLGLGIVVIIAVALFGGGPNKGQSKKGKGKKGQDVKYVKVVEVKNDTVPVTVSASGRVTSSRNVNLTAEVQGKLEEGALPLKAGQRFKQGDVLFKINDAEQRLTLQSRKSQFLNLVAGILPDLKMDYKDNFNKWEAFFKELDVTRNMPEMPKTASVNEKTFLASRNVLSEYYGIKADEERLKKYRIVAPFNGAYTNVSIEVGTVVNPGTQIAKIIHDNSLEVTLPISTDEISLVQEGMNVNIFNEEGQQKWTGAVARVSQNVNQGTQSVDVFVKINGLEKNSLFEGMYVTAEIVAGNIPDAMLISRKSLFNNNKVYVVADSMLNSREVVLRKINEESAIVEGLSDGKLLVTEPLVGAKENSKVIPLMQ